MMQLPVENPVVRDAVYNTILTTTESVFICSDYDNCKFAIKKDCDKNTIILAFTCYNFKEIYKAGQQFFMKRWYPEFTLQEASLVPGFDISIEASLDELKDTLKVKKGIDPEQEAKIKEQNAIIKESNKKLMDKFSNSLSRFKRNFYGAPYERILTEVEEDKKSIAEIGNVEFSQRPGERTWVIVSDDEKSKKKQVSVFYGISFTDKVDKALAKLILDEMEESRRHVKDPPAVSRTFEGSKIPQSLVNAFPSAKNPKEKFTNGIISITLFKESHINNQTEKSTTYLAGLRQYLHYHIHASKSYLHSRIVKKINLLYKNLSHSKFEKDEDKYYRTQKEENLLVKAKSDDIDPLKKKII